MARGRARRVVGRQAAVRGLVGLAIVVGTTMATVPLATVAGASPGWTAPTSVDNTAPEVFSSVSCPTATFCMAVDFDGRALTYNGSHWSAPVTILSSDPVSSVSCASATLCAAIDYDGQAFIYNGHHWSAPDVIDYGAAMPSVSCAPGSTFCIAVSGDLGPYGFIYNGSSWSSAVLMDSASTTGMASVSCPTASSCTAFDVSGNVVSTSDGGSTWTPYSNVDASGSPESVSCASTTFCAMVDDDGNAFTYNGVSWSGANNIDGFRLNSVSCATASFCVAVDGHSNGFVTTDSGASWTESAYIGPGNYADSLSAVSCVTTTFCPVVDSIGQVFYWAGGWTGTTLIDEGPAQLTSVSCVSSVFCAAVDHGGNALTYDGTSWSTPVNLANRAMVSVSCATASFCVAVDQGGDAFTYNGERWSSGGGVSEGPLDAVSCTATPTTFCVAVDGEGNVYTTDDGTTWTGNQVDSFNQLTSVSCATASFCVAVDADGNALVWDGSAWTSDGDVNSSNALISVSCTTTPESFCTAVGNVGAALAYNGGSWSAPYTFDSNAPQAVSCPTETSCTAVDNGGDALTWDGDGNTGADWSSTSVDSGNDISSVSCPSASFCVAVDDDGNAIVDDGAAPAVVVSAVSPNTGPTSGATTVTITGSGFTPGNTVDFGGVEASGVSVNGPGTSITADSPAASTAGTVDVIVTTSSGSSTPNPADEFTYTVTQSPSPTPCTPSCTQTTSTPLDETVAKVTGSSGNVDASVSVVVNTGTLTCPGAYDYTTAVAQESASNFSPGTTVKVTDTVGNEPSTKGVKVCYGATDAVTGSFLKTCAHHPAPCIKSLVEHDGGVVATLSVPAVDPRFWTGTGALDLTSFSPTHGPPLKKVTIKGKNLTAVTAVVIGGAQARIISASSTKVVVEVPQGAVTGDITVTADSGQVVSAVPFTVT